MKSFKGSIQVFRQNVFSIKAFFFSIKAYFHTLGRICKFGPSCEFFLLDWPLVSRGVCRGCDRRRGSWKKDTGLKLDHAIETDSYLKLPILVNVGTNKRIFYKN
jgi:hypothetical protein